MVVVECAHVTGVLPPAPVCMHRAHVVGMLVLVLVGMPRRRVGACGVALVALAVARPRPCVVWRPLVLRPPLLL